MDAADYLDECWVCREEFRPNTGVSLEDNGMEIVCRACWNEIPNHWRILLCWLFREADEGGAGIKNVLLTAIERSGWPISPPGSN